MNHRANNRWLRRAGRLVYWLVVLAISLGLLVALVMFFEARDESQIDEGAKARSSQPSVTVAGSRWT